MTHIAISGLRHSGKTTLAKEFLKQNFWYVRLALADPLKDSVVEMCNTFLELHGRDLMTREDLERDKSQLRPLLQFVGTEFAREYVGPDDFWIKLFEMKVKDAEAQGDLVVCDDVRFPNEAERLRELGFLIVKVSRRESERQASLALAGDTGENHPSETSVHDIKADIYLNCVPHHDIPLVVSYILDPAFSPTYPINLWHEPDGSIWGVRENPPVFTQMVAA